jgi:hypothetical protein
MFNFQLDIATGGHPIPLQFLPPPKPVRSEVNPELTMLACRIAGDSISATAYRGGRRTLARTVSRAGRLVYLRVNLKPGGGVYNLVDSNGMMVSQEHVWFCEEFSSHEARESAAKTALVAFKLWKEQADKNYAKEVRKWKIDRAHWEHHAVTVAWKSGKGVFDENFTTETLREYPLEHCESLLRDVSGDKD